jgi:hypothetical protein
LTIPQGSRQSQLERKKNLSSCLPKENEKWPREMSEKKNFAMRSNTEHHVLREKEGKEGSICFMTL